MDHRIKCIILEDEELAAKSLIQIISKVENLDLQGHFYNPLEAKNKIDLSSIDLIFLDVEMPEISGLDFIKTLNNPPKVIVTTSKSDFAMGAFEIEAIDFILKPVSLASVIKSLRRFEQFEDRSSFETTEDAIFVKVDSKLVNLKFDEILWLEALGDYVRFHMEGDKRYVVKATLTSIDKHINLDNFVRVHRSYVVNTKHIHTIDNDSLVIQNQWIPISRSNRPELLKKINLLR